VSFVLAWQLIRHAIALAVTMICQLLNLNKILIVPWEDATQVRAQRRPQCGPGRLSSDRVVFRGALHLDCVGISNQRVRRAYTEAHPRGVSVDEVEHLCLPKR
jgi:hypothetical protein